MINRLWDILMIVTITIIDIDINIGPDDYC